jgi:hypothetical protein
MSHTPGPWLVDPKRRLRIFADDDITVASTGCTDSERDRWEANAALIAAAPELLDALCHMRWCASCAEGGWEDCEGGRAALAAIAKAEGRIEQEEKR